MSDLISIQGLEMNIGILGAGIVGLNTALKLQTEFPNAQITVIADKFEEDTLSYGAAGIFRPGTNLAGPSPKITQYEYYNIKYYLPIVLIIQYEGYNRNY